MSIRLYMKENQSSLSARHPNIQKVSRRLKNMTQVEFPINRSNAEYNQKLNHTQDSSDHDRSDKYDDDTGNFSKENPPHHENYWSQSRRQTKQSKDVKSGKSQLSNYEAGKVFEINQARNRIEKDMKVTRVQLENSDITPNQLRKLLRESDEMVLTLMKGNDNLNDLLMQTLKSNEQLKAQIRSLENKFALTKHELDGKTRILLERSRNRSEATFIENQLSTLAQENELLLMEKEKLLEANRRLNMTIQKIAPGKEEVSLEHDQLDFYEKKHQAASKQYEEKIGLLMNENSQQKQQILNLTRMLQESQNQVLQLTQQQKQQQALLQEQQKKLNQLQQQQLIHEDKHKSLQQLSQPQQLTQVQMGHMKPLDQNTQGGSTQYDNSMSSFPLNTPAHQRTQSYGFGESFSGQDKQPPKNVLWSNQAQVTPSTQDRATRPEFADYSQEKPVRVQNEEEFMTSDQLIASQPTKDQADFDNNVQAALATGPKIRERVKHASFSSQIPPGKGPSREQSAESKPPGTLTFKHPSASAHKPQILSKNKGVTREMVSPFDETNTTETGSQDDKLRLQAFSKNETQQLSSTQKSYKDSFLETPSRVDHRRSQISRSFGGTYAFPEISKTTSPTGTANISELTQLESLNDRLREENERLRLIVREDEKRFVNYREVFRSLDLRAKDTITEMKKEYEIALSFKEAEMEALKTDMGSPDQQEYIESRVLEVTTAETTHPQKPVYTTEMSPKHTTLPTATSEQYTKSYVPKEQKPASMYLNSLLSYRPGQRDYNYKRIPAKPADSLQSTYRSSGLAQTTQPSQMEHSESKKVDQASISTTHHDRKSSVQESTSIYEISNLSQNYNPNT